MKSLAPLLLGFGVVVATAAESGAPPVKELQWLYAEAAAAPFDLPAAPLNFAASPARVNGDDLFGAVLRADEERVLMARQIPEPLPARSSLDDVVLVDRNASPASQPNLRGLAPSNQGAPRIWDLLDDDPDDEPFDFWEFVVWVGTVLGKAAKLVITFLGKVAQAIWIGISKGWDKQQQAQQPTPPPAPTSASGY